MLHAGSPPFGLTHKVLTLDDHLSMAHRLPRIIPSYPHPLVRLFSHFHPPHSLLPFLTPTPTSLFLLFLLPTRLPPPNISQKGFASANVRTFYETTKKVKLSTVAFSARRLLVFEEFRVAKISCFGLQETRATSTRIYHVENYLVVSSQCDKFRNYGIETCIDTKFKINACSASMEAVILICAEPTILLISVQLGTWLVYYLNFHAPQCEAKASRGDPKKMTIAQRKA